MVHRLREEAKGHVPPPLLRAAHSSVRQAGGSSSYSHGFPSFIDGVSGRLCHVLAGEWEYVDGAAVQLTLDEQGNGRKDGRFETRTLIDHTWQRHVVSEEE